MSYLYICWRDNTAGHKQSRRFLECIDDNFLTQMIKKHKRRDTLLDLTLANKEEQVRDVKAGGSLCCSDHGMVKFRIVRGENKANSRITTLSFRRTDFGLFRDGLGRIPWVMILE